MKEIRTHRKDERHAMWKPARLEGKVRNKGINPIKKSKKMSLKTAR
ncbi:MAG: hypothetical protein P4L81_00965 [Candidatus Pacebacteria bacterium]|nr:hypothetical protein [Candidatus Paceibacterota bacterium]